MLLTRTNSCDVDKLEFPPHALYSSTLKKILQQTTLTSLHNINRLAQVMEKNVGTEFLNNAT